MMPRFAGTRVLLLCLFPAALLFPVSVPGQDAAPGAGGPREAVPAEVAGEGLRAVPAGEATVQAAHAAAGNVYVSVEGGLLSVRLEDASLVDVLEELSRRSGMRIKLDREASKRITLTFRNMPFEKGIRNLVRPLGYAMVWTRTRDAAGNEVDVLEELHIFREGHQGGAVVELAPPEPGQPAEGEPRPVTKRVWDEETRQRMLEKMRVVPSEP